MTGLCSSAKLVLASFARREHSNNPKTHPLRLKKESVFRSHRRNQSELNTALVVWFVKAAVSQFALGNAREARRFYDGAFEFGTKDLIRGRMFGCLLASAAKAYAEGDHEVVLRLLAAAHSYPPRVMTVQEIHHVFEHYGVSIKSLELDRSTDSLDHMRRVGVNLPALATA